MNTKRILLSGVIVWIISASFGWLTCGWLFNWVYLLPPIIWQDPSTNMIWINLIGLVVAIIFAYVFALIYNGIPGKGIKKGVTYGLIIWLVGALSGFTTLPFYMTIATTVIVYWILQSLVLNLINGIIVASIYKK